VGVFGELTGGAEHEGDREHDAYFWASGERCVPSGCCERARRIETVGDSRNERRWADDVCAVSA
jgi:hypothetical protein